MGLQASHGLSALQQSLRQRIADRLAQQQQELQNQITTRGADRADRQLDETSALRRAQEAETSRQHDLADQDRNDAQDRAFAEMIPADASIATGNPIAGRLRRIGMLDESKARPAVDVGPLLPGDTGDERMGTKIATAAQLKERAAQADRETDNARQQAAADAAAKAAQTPVPVMRVNPRTGKVEQIGEAPKDRISRRSRSQRQPRWSRSRR